METTFRDQEPGLYDVIHPMVVRWKLLCGGVILAVLLGLVLSLLMAKQYETTILLNIGMSVDRQLEDPNSVVRIINSPSFQKTAAESIQLSLSSKQLQKMIHAETDTIRTTPTIFVGVLADTPERAVALANAVADGIISRHRIFFNEKLQQYLDYRAELEKMQGQYVEEIEKIRSTLTTSKSADLSAVMMLQARLGDKETQLFILKKELRDNKVFMSKVHSRETALAGPPVLPKKASKPNFKLNLLVAAIAGFFVMFSFILLSEQYRKGSIRF